MDIWQKTAMRTDVYEDTSTIDEEVLRVTRRDLTFKEELDLIARVTDKQTRRPDMLELLALTVQTCVKDSNFGITADRVRLELPERPALAWHLINWLCEKTMKNLNMAAGTEAMRKKSGKR